VRRPTPAGAGPRAWSQSVQEARADEGGVAYRKAAADRLDDDRAPESPALDDHLGERVAESTQHEHRHAHTAPHVATMTMPRACPDANQDVAIFNRRSSNS
jgi:hypothetical protein